MSQSLGLQLKQANKASLPAEPVQLFHPITCPPPLLVTFLSALLTPQDYTCGQRACLPSANSSPPTGLSTPRCWEELPSAHIYFNLSHNLVPEAECPTLSWRHTAPRPCQSVELCVGVSLPTGLSHIQAWSCSLDRCPCSPAAGWGPGSVQVTPEKPKAACCTPDLSSLRGVGSRWGPV